MPSFLRLLLSSTTRPASPFSMLVSRTLSTPLLSPISVPLPAAGAVLLITSLAGRAAAAPSVRIMPPDRSTFPVGQRFDLRVEASGLPPSGAELQVTLNGTPIDRVAGATVRRSAAAPGLREITVRGLSFPRSLHGSIEAVVAGADPSTGTDETVTARTGFEVVEIRGNSRPARNVIFFIGDGMGFAHRTAARAVSRGLRNGYYNGLLEMDRMTAHGYVFPSSLNGFVPDSAATASARAGGHKTDNGALCVWPDNTDDPFDNPRYETAVEFLKRTRGMATGVVSTAHVTDATPAGFLSHSYQRGQGAGIAAQFLVTAPNVVFGGGRNDFTPKALGGNRVDGRNLINEFRSYGYATVSNAAELAALPLDTRKALGLFNGGVMTTYVDRREARRANSGAAALEPGLVEMTEKAIGLLSRQPGGFFLMVEGASIDKQAHNKDAHRSIWETIEFDRAIGAAKRFAEKHGDTLIVVTADHETGGMAVLGMDYAKRTLEIGWGSLSTTAPSVIRTTTPVNPGGALNEPDYLPSSETTGPKSDGTGHTAIDLPLSAMGPGSSLLNGPMPDTNVFLAILRALHGRY